MPMLQEVKIYDLIRNIKNEFDKGQTNKQMAEIAYFIKQLGNMITPGKINNLNAIFFRRLADSTIGIYLIWICFDKQIRGYVIY